jgi:type I restriction enzyme S subunit
LALRVGVVAENEHVGVAIQGKAEFTPRGMDTPPPPEHWQAMQLGDVATLQRGIDLPRDQRRNGPYPVVGSNGVVGYHSEYRAHGPGVFVGRSGSVGKVAWIEEDYWPLNTTLWVKDFHGNDPGFVYYLLSQIDFGKYTAGVSVPTLNRNLVHPIRVAVPPAPEQKAIASVLHTVQRDRRATEKVIAVTRELKRSLMRYLFTYGPMPPAQAENIELQETEIGPMPRHWGVVRLGDVAKIGNGSTPKRTNHSYWDGGTIPWLTSGKVHEEIIESASEFVTELAAKECHLPVVKSGSLVVAITGQGKTLGNAALVSFDTRVSQHLAYVRFENDRVDSEFLLGYLQMRYPDLRAVASAGGSTKGALTCGFLATYPIPLPPIEEQTTIAAILHATRRKVAAESRRRQILDYIFTAARSDLVTGKRRVASMEATNG